MRVATPRPRGRAFRLLASALLLAAALGRIEPARAEEDDLPSDRHRLEAPEQNDNNTDGFELPTPTAPADTSDSAAGADATTGWNTDDPRIARREDRLLLVASTYGFAGAFGGFSVWALVASASQQTPKGKRDWRRISGVLAAVSGAALILGTVIWATSPKAPNEGPITAVAVGVQLGPRDAAAQLQLRFF